LIEIKTAARKAARRRLQLLSCWILRPFLSPYVCREILGGKIADRGPLLAATEGAPRTQFRIEGTASPQAKIFPGSGKFVPPLLKMRLLGPGARGAMRRAFVQLLRRLAFRLRIFVGSNGIVRLQKALSILMPKRFGIREELRTGGA